MKNIKLYRSGPESCPSCGSERIYKSHGGFACGSCWNYWGGYCRKCGQAKPELWHGSSYRADAQPCPDCEPEKNKRLNADTIWKV